MLEWGITVTDPKNLKNIDGTKREPWQPKFPDREVTPIMEGMLEGAPVSYGAPIADIDDFTDLLVGSQEIPDLAQLIDGKPVTDASLQDGKRRVIGPQAYVLAAFETEPNSDAVTILTPVQQAEPARIKEYMRRLDQNAEPQITQHYLPGITIWEAKETERAAVSA